MIATNSSAKKVYFCVLRRFRLPGGVSLFFSEMFLRFLSSFVLLSLHRMSTAREWWMDGTFSANPTVFSQLYTIHIKVHEEFIPQLWCLLPDKQGTTYVRLFQLLKQEALNNNTQLLPNTIHVDFEMAVMQAVRSEFLIDAVGCLFHFSQSVLRHMQHLGLQMAYNSNAPPEVRQWIRRLIALPLVPPIRLDQAFQAIVLNSPNVPGRDAMNDYVFNTYVDANNALFPRDIWNCYGLQDRTTNICEGYHSSLNSHFQHRSPDPYAFIAFLQQQDLQLERRVAQLQAGAPPKKRKAKYVLVNEAVLRLQNQYFSQVIPSIGRVIQYMDAVAHQLYDVKH